MADSAITIPGVDPKQVMYCIHMVQKSDGSFVPLQLDPKLGGIPIAVKSGSTMPIFTAATTPAATDPKTF